VDELIDVIMEDNQGEVALDAGKLRRVIARTKDNAARPLGSWRKMRPRLRRGLPVATASAVASI